MGAKGRAPKKESKCDNTYLHSPHMNALFFLRFLAYRYIAHRKQKRFM